MVALNFTASTYLSTLCDKLTARPGLAGVNVSSGPLTNETGGSEAIEFGEVLNTIDWYALGRKARKETYTVSGWIFKVEYGGSEAVIRATRDRAFAILDEVNDCLVTDPTVNGVVTTCGITNVTLSQVITGKNTNARGAAINFTVTVEAIIRA